MAPWLELKAHENTLKCSIYLHVHFSPNVFFRNFVNIKKSVTFLVIVCAVFFKFKYKSNVNFTKCVSLLVYVTFEDLEKNTLERFIGHIFICFRNYYSNCPFLLEIFIELKPDFIGVFSIY